MNIEPDMIVEDTDEDEDTAAIQNVIEVDLVTGMFCTGVLCDGAGMLYCCRTVALLYG